MKSKMKIVTNLEEAGILPMCQAMDKYDFEHLEQTGRGDKILATLNNMRILLKKYGLEVKYNEISKVIDGFIPGTKETDMNYLEADVTSLCNLNSYPVGSINSFLKRLAVDCKFNPVKDWINSKEWDKVDRFCDVVESIKVPERYEEAKRVYLKRWCYSAVAMLDNNLERDLSYEGVLVFQGEQGLGKTMWARKLCGDMSIYFKDALTIDPHNKDSVMGAVSIWIGEIGELDATFKKSDISALKAFITSNKDKLRRPFDKWDSIFARKSVYMATVNGMDFLKDPSGNRRYWCLPVTSLKLPDDFDSQQFWAQIQHMLINEPENKRFDKWFLNADEIKMRDRLNKAFTEIDPIEEMILKLFSEHRDEKTWYYMSATDVTKLIGEKPMRSTVSCVGRVLTKEFGKPKQMSKGNFYKLPRPYNMTHEIMGRDRYKQVEK